MIKSRYGLNDLRLGAVLMITTGITWPVFGQTVPTDQPSPLSPTERATPAPGQEGPGTAAEQAASATPKGIWERANLLGDIGGLRTVLGNYGISLGLTETSEVLGNVTGGVHQGAAYDGVTQLTVAADLSKMIGLEGAIFNVSGLQIHGRNLSTDNLLSLQTASGIEADRSTRLWELWYQQSFLHGKFDVRLGQQSLDQEFMISQQSSIFINTAMGWPLIPSVDLYAGSSVYPLSSLGVRLRGQPTDTITILGGVFNDNPPGGPFNNDSQLRGAEQTGTRFNLNTGALFIAEIQYALNAASPAEGAPPVGLPGTYKLGFWYDTATFPDQRFDQNGLSLADPASTGIARMRRGNFSIYGLMDQVVWQPDPKSARALGVFARFMGAPEDRNLINFAFDAGVTLKAPFAGRDSDTVGLGYGFGQVSGSASNLDKDVGRFTGTAFPVRSSESFIELTYQAQIAPWWLVQPDLQYVFNPGGGIPNPNLPGARIKNEFVLGLRTNITF
jgi:porin